MLILTFPLAWPPGIEEYPSDKHSNVWAKAGDHPGTSRLLFLGILMFRTYCFFHVLFSPTV